MIAAVAQRCTLQRAKALPRIITGGKVGARQEHDFVAQLAEELREMVEAGRVGAARERLEKLSPTELEQPLLSKWAKALKLPIVRIGAPGNTSSISANAEWIRAHGQKYASQWVALRDGKLVGHQSSELALHKDLEGRNETENVVFLYLHRS